MEEFRQGRYVWSVCNERVRFPREYRMYKGSGRRNARRVQRRYLPTERSGPVPRTRCVNGRPNVFRLGSIARWIFHGSRGRFPVSNPKELSGNRAARPAAASPSRPLRGKKLHEKSIRGIRGNEFSLGVRERRKGVEGTGVEEIIGGTSAIVALRVLEKRDSRTSSEGD